MVTSHNMIKSLDSSYDSSIQLASIQVNEEYSDEWNVDLKDFLVLTKNGEMISDSLYRKGGFNFDLTKDYIMILLREYIIINYYESKK